MSNRRSHLGIYGVAAREVFWLLACLATLALLNVALIFWAMTYLKMTATALQVDNSNSEGLLLQIGDVSNRLLGLGILVTVAQMTIVYFLVVRIYTRILGPQIPIKRFIDNLKEGNVTAPLKLRDHDAYQDVAASLNQLAGKIHLDTPTINPRG